MNTPTLPRLAGVIPILATPFHDDETPDHASLARMIAFMGELGVTGVTLLGVLLLSGCAEGVKFIQETDTGGVVARFRRSGETAGAGRGVDGAVQQVEVRQGQRKRGGAPCEA